MRLLFYIPDNLITKNYMPVLWPWLLKALTPKQHSIRIIDGNAEKLSPGEVADVAKKERIDLVGIGAMTRTVRTAYATADAVRKLSIPVVMGGPHVGSDSNFLRPDPEEIVKEALQHCDSVVVGEADDLWPQVLSDFENGRPLPCYKSVAKPDLRNYPRIPWEEANLKQFTVIPTIMKQMVRASGFHEFDFNLTPMETGRGCPYGCDFCTVTNFFGDKVRIRTVESVVEEILLLKELRRTFIFFVDDNFAIYDKFGHVDPDYKHRSRKLMQAMIDAKATVPWAAQISSNLLDPETSEGKELVDLMRGSGCIGVYIGLESVIPSALKEISKSFNKPANYERILQYLDGSGIYPVTGFIFGMDSDQKGVADSTWDVIRHWPPSAIPVFSPLTPLPGTPQFAKFRQEGRLLENHWMNYKPYATAFLPKQMSGEELHLELRSAWAMAYAPGAIFDRMRKTRNRPLFERLIIFVANLCFRGVFFPQMNGRAWLKLFWENRRSFYEIFFRSRRWTKREHLLPISKHPEHKKAFPTGETASSYYAPVNTAQ